MTAKIDRRADAIFIIQYTQGKPFTSSLKNHLKWSEHRLREAIYYGREHGLFKVVNERSNPKVYVITVWGKQVYESREHPAE